MPNGKNGRGRPRTETLEDNRAAYDRRFGAGFSAKLAQDATHLSLAELFHRYRRRTGWRSRKSVGYALLQITGKPKTPVRGLFKQFADKRAKRRHQIWLYRKVRRWTRRRVAALYHIKVKAVDQTLRRHEERMAQLTPRSIP